MSSQVIRYGKLKKRYYLLQDENNISIKVIQIDFSSRTPLQDSVARPMLERKLIESIGKWKGEHVFRKIVNIEEAEVKDTYWITVAFHDEDLGNYEEIYSLDEIEIC